MNAGKYHVLLSSGTAGPFTAEEMRMMGKSGAITAETDAWREGDAEWRKVRDYFAPAKRLTAEQIGLLLAWGIPCGVVLLAVAQEPQLITGFVLLIVYMIPTYVGAKKRNAGAICALNVFLGWTFVGWVVALVWALTVEPPLPSQPQQ